MGGAELGRGAHEDVVVDTATSKALSTGALQRSEQRSPEDDCGVSEGWPVLLPE